MSAKVVADYKPQRFGEKLLSYLFRSKVIGGDCYAEKGPLMIRWYVLETKRFTILIHKFLRSDLDRAYHSHPWWFRTLLLTGGYW